ncbi:MAG: hypothetical protein RR654_10520, partial [Oscillospiraceae bacterium]
KLCFGLHRVVIITHRSFAAYNKSKALLLRVSMFTQVSKALLWFTPCGYYTILNAKCASILCIFS